MSWQSYASRLTEEVEAYRTQGPSACAAVSASPAYQTALETATWVLRFTCLLLRHAINKHVYHSLPVRGGQA